MAKHNAKNERIKHEYFRYLAEADGKSRATIHGVQKSICRFEAHNGYKDFRNFNREHAIAFKKNLAKDRAKHSGEALSKATVHSTLNHVKSFMKWLAQQRGYKSKIHLPDIGYLSLTDKEVRTAKAKRMKRFPTLEQIHRVIFAMPHKSEVEMRDRALIAFTILTGIRVKAMASLKLKHVDLAQELVTQDPREVDTKFSKLIHTYFFPVGDDIKKIFIDWVNFLQETKLYGYDAPLFPSTRLEQGADLEFVVTGLESEHWSTTSPARRIFQEAFEANNLPYYGPHSFRHTLGHLMSKRCKNVEEILAWSQSLGHESPKTTFESYGQMDPYRQGEVLRNMKITVGTLDIT